jgi:hypothetical protein
MVHDARLDDASTIDRLKGKENLKFIRRAGKSRWLATRPLAILTGASLPLVIRTPETPAGMHDFTRVDNRHGSLLDNPKNPLCLDYCVCLATCVSGGIVLSPTVAPTPCMLSKPSARWGRFVSVSGMDRSVSHVGS